MNPFSWLMAIAAAGNRLAASMNSMSDILEDLRSQLRHASGLEEGEPLALPATRRKKVETVVRNGKG
jgi:hypothetical protein